MLLVVRLISNSPQALIKMSNAVIALGLDPKNRLIDEELLAGFSFLFFSLFIFMSFL